MAAPVSRTLGQLLEELAQTYGDKPALLYKDRVLSFREWNHLSSQFAKGLYDLGIRKGDRVALLMGNCIEWFVTVFAAAKIGAVLVAVNTWYKADDLRQVLRHSGAKALVMQDRFLKRDYVELLREVVPELAGPPPLKSAALPELERVIVYGDRVPVSAHAFSAIVERGAELSDTILSEQAPQPDDLMYILFTSGSTAKPKGVTLVHQYLILNGFDIGERQHIQDRDRLWLGIPLFFSLGSANAIMATLTHGASIVIQEVFEAEEAMRLIEQHRCTIYYGMPVMTHAIYYHPNRSQYDLSSLDKGVTIGPEETLRLTMKLVPHISNVYGATETYGNCAVCDGRLDPDIRATSQGQPLPGMKIKIVDPQTRRPLPTGEVGEVCVGGYVTPGYYNDPENNAKSFDEEGYYLTGDLGFLDENGFFHYVGRLKEMIKTGGINVSPLSVEECLLKHPDVREAHVIGVPDPVKDEVVMAIIEKREGSSVTEADIIQYCRERLPSYSVPRYVEFWEASQFPRTDTGKVAKRLLLEMIQQRTG